MTSVKIDSITTRRMKKLYAHNELMRLEFQIDIARRTINEYDNGKNSNIKVKLYSQLDAILDNARMTYDQSVEKLQRLFPAESSLYRQLCYNEHNNYLKASHMNVILNISSETKNMCHVPLLILTLPNKVNNFSEFREITGVLKLTTPPLPYWERITGENFVLKGKQYNEVDTCKGMAFDPWNNDIYIIDWFHNRIQVLTMDGEYIRTLMTEEISYSHCILVTKGHVYLRGTTNIRPHILKLDKLTGKLTACVSISPAMSTFVLKNNNNRNQTQNLMICSTWDPTVYTLSLNELEVISKFKLECEYIKLDSSCMAIEIYKQQIIALFSKSEYPLQVFSIEGSFLKTICDNKLIRDPKSFCIDLAGNFIVSHSNNIIILSDSGSSIVTYEFKNSTPRDVKINYKQQIIVYAPTNNTLLQIF